MTTLNHILVTRPEFQKTLFNKAVGANGKTYYYNGDPYSVWVETDGMGMGGRTVSYELMEGGSEEVKGPWNTNARDLFVQTGIDLNENYWSYGIVFANRKDSLAFVKGDVEVPPVVSDREWKKGEYDGAVKRMVNKINSLGLNYETMDVVVVDSFGKHSITALKSVI